MCDTLGLLGTESGHTHQQQASFPHPTPTWRRGGGRLTIGGAGDSRADPTPFTPPADAQLHSQMLLLLVLARFAWAAPPTLDPAGARRLAEARFDQGPLSVQVGAAVVLPVVQDGRTIGVGFVGPGALALSFPA